MSYFHTMTDMLVGASPEHEKHVYQTVMLIDSMIHDIVPQMIDDYLKTHIDDLTANVSTLLNGKPTDLDGLRADIIALITEKLSKS